jgi:hypothetical protein
MKPISPRAKAALAELINLWNDALKEGIKPDEQALLDKLK